MYIQPRLHLPRGLKLLYLTLPVILWIVAQYFSRLFDADESFVRITGFGCVLDIREDEVGKLFGGIGVSDIGVRDVQYMFPGEGFLDGQAECLSAIASVDVAEAAESHVSITTS